MKARAYLLAVFMLLVAPVHAGLGRCPGVAQQASRLNTSASLAAGAPPHTLLNAADIARINNWAATYAWAAVARDELLAAADSWPAQYLADYNLSGPDLPPDGGYQGGWYICPDGTDLKYVPAHTPPHFCPSTGEYYASPPQWPDWPDLYDQVIYKRRHFDLAEYARSLGLAYQLTGHTAYASGAADILRAYATRYLTYPLHADYLSPDWWASAARVTSQTLDEAQWLIDVAWAYDLIAESDALSPADHTAIADGLLLPAATQIAGNQLLLSNWQTWHNAALAITGLVLDAPDLFSGAFYDPGGGFFAQVTQGAAADGFWWEGSWGYHFLALHALVYLAEMGVRAGLDPYAAPNLQAMFSVPLQMAAPDGDLTLPPFNDGTIYSLATGRLSWLYEIGYNHYRDPQMVLPLARMDRSWQGLLWGVESLPDVSVESPTSSALLPEAGYAVLRSVSPDGVRFLALDFGPHGGWHGHYDKLGYVSYAFGKALATDPGSHSYASPLHDGWDRTTVAHNTVVVDEQNQAKSTGSAHRYAALPAMSLAMADAGPAYPGTTLTRTVVLNADYWLDVTTARGADGYPHRYDWVYHNPGALSTPLPLAPYTALPPHDGYDYLLHTEAADTGEAWQVSWDASGVGQPWGPIWRSDDGIRVTCVVTEGVASNGSASIQTDYDLGSTDSGGLLFYSPHLTDVQGEAPSYFDVQVYGDASDNRLGLKVEDATGEGFHKQATAIGWTGWRQVGLPFDDTWWHAGGDNDGVFDPPARRIGVSVSHAPDGAGSGRIFADEVALTFPLAGRQVVEDFEDELVRLRLTVLGAPDTTVVVGDGLDRDNRMIPFAMARRETEDTVFSALFEPYRSSPGITQFTALPVVPDSGSPLAFRVALAGFADSLLLTDGDPMMDRSFGDFSTDSSVAYVRQEPGGDVRTAVLVDGTKLAMGPLSVLTCTLPVTLELDYSGSSIWLTLPTVPIAQLRIYAPEAAGVFVNGRIAHFERDGPFVMIPLSPDPARLFLPIVFRGH